MKNLLPLITIISIPLASPLGASADETLTSNPAATGLGQSGNIFNIKAKKAIKINGFSQDFSSNNSTHYKSYYKIGGYEGSVKTRSNYPQNYFDSLLIFFPHHLFLIPKLLTCRPHLLALNFA